MNKTEIVLAAIGIISLVSLAGVTVAYSNTLANQQQNQNLLLYYYFGIPPLPYSITFIVSNATDPNNTVTVTKRLTWSDLLTLQNTTFSSGSGSLETGPSLNNITYYFFGLNLTSLNLTNSSALDIAVVGAAGGTGLGQLIYKFAPWELGEISSEYPILDYAEGGGGGTATYIGTCKFCAPTTWIQKTNYVKAVNTIGITFNSSA